MTCNFNKLLLPNMRESGVRRIIDSLCVYMYVHIYIYIYIYSLTAPGSLNRLKIKTLAAAWHKYGFESHSPQYWCSDQDVIATLPRVVLSTVYALHVRYLDICNCKYGTYNSSRASLLRSIKPYLECCISW